MKRYVLFLLLFTSVSFPQPQNPEWINYTVTDLALSILEEENILWLCTSGGLVEFNKTSNQFNVFNKANCVLPSNNVLSGAIDSEGYKWLCTYNGLVKFKENEWIVFNTSNSGLPQNHLTSIIIDENDVKWIGTSGMGLAAFDDTDWVIFNTANSSLPSDKIRTLNYRNNILWIGTTNGIARKTGNLITNVSVTSGKIINSADFDYDGNLWFAVGYFSIGNKGLYKLTPSDDLQQISTLSGVDIKTDNHNVKWFAFHEEIGSVGILTVDSAGQNITYPNEINTMIPYPWFYSMHFDENDTKWFGSAQGLLKITPTGTGTLIPTSNNKLGRDYISKLFIDRNNRKWFYAWGSIPLSSQVLPPGYLSVFAGNTWSNFNEQNSPITIGGVIAAAEGPGTSMYFAPFNVMGNTSLYRYNQGSWLPISVPATQYDRILYMWYDISTGDLWVDFEGANYQNNLFIYTGFSWLPVNAYPFYDINYAVSRNGIIWFASPQGLVKYDGSSFTTFTTANSGLPHNNVSSIEFDSYGNMWLGTWEGLAKFDGTNWTIYNRYNSPLISDNISQLAIDSLNNIYIGTLGSYNQSSMGFVKFNGIDEWRVFNNRNSGKPESPISPLWPYYNDPIPEDVYAVSLDESGKIWIATDGGAGVYDKDGIPVPVELLHFTAGVSGNNINLNWSTASEINNIGFEIFRSYDEIKTIRIAFIPGAGTSSIIKNYTYTDSNLDPGKYIYSLVQYDLDGTKKEIATAAAELSGNLGFSLSQNYPNPFNPSTTFEYTIADDALVTIKVFDVLGRAAAVLINEQQTKGSYKLNWNAAALPSGVYFYKINAGAFNETRKMILVR